MLNKISLLQHLVHHEMMTASGSATIGFIQHYDQIQGNVVINPIRIKSTLLKKQAKAIQQRWVKYGQQSLLEQFLDVSQLTVYETETDERCDTKTNLKRLKKAGIHYVLCMTIDRIDFLRDQSHSLLWGMMDTDSRTYVATEITVKMIDTNSDAAIYQSCGKHAVALSDDDAQQLSHVTEGTVMNVMETAAQSAMRNLIRGWAYTTQS